MFVATLIIVTQMYGGKYNVKHLSSLFCEAFYIQIYQLIMLLQISDSTRRQHSYYFEEFMIYLFFLLLQ